MSNIKPGQGYSTYFDLHVKEQKNTSRGLLSILTRIPMAMLEFFIFLFVFFNSILLLTNMHYKD